MAARHAFIQVPEIRVIVPTTGQKLVLYSSCAHPGALTVIGNITLPLKVGVIIPVSVPWMAKFPEKSTDNINVPEEL